MTGTLYVVGTPIGNLSDITVRQLDTLREVDFIAAEDTRVTWKLLTHFDIHTPLLSYHDHSTRSCAEGIVERIRGGESCAVVTDAGMPCISDPGEGLVRLCCDADIPVRVVPGPSAAISALAISGLSTARFSFEGFLSTTSKQRREHLESLRQDCHTLIFYEAPHKLRNTLEDLLTHLGDRRIALCRELTKVYEEVLRFRISEAIAYYAEKAPKGEYVLIVEGAMPSEGPVMTLAQACDLVQALVQDGMRGAEACRQMAKETGFSKSELYAALLTAQKNKDEDS